MNIFISWSGDGSHGLALLLKEWLPTVLPYVRPWLSSDDIRKGKPWDAELTAHLEATSYSVVCVTSPEVAKAPWVNFEAGAVSKYVDHAHVNPLLVNVSLDHMSGLPMARYQCTQFTKTDVGRLLRSINDAADAPISPGELNRNLRNTWRQLRAEVDDLDVTTGHDSRKEDDEYDDDDRDDPLIFLEETEEKILGLIAHFDPRNPTVDEILSYVQENRTRVKHYLDCLVTYGFLHCQMYVGGDSTYSVTQAGRTYLVEHDLV